MLGERCFVFLGLDTDVDFRRFGSYGNTCCQLRGTISRKAEGRASAKYDWQRFNKESPVRTPVPAPEVFRRMELCPSWVPSTQGLGFRV